MSVSEEQRLEWKEAFGLFDTNGSGTVNLRDIGTVMRSVGQNPTQAEIAEITRGVTEEQVDFEGFCRMLSAKFVTNAEAEAEIRESFKIFDKNGSGLISAAELRHVMSSLGEPLSAEEVEELIGQVEIDDQGMLQYEDFIAQLLKP